jgi:hypothetical protein
MKTALVICLVSGVAHADFIVVNNPVADSVGFYSDAFVSNGEYTYASSGAQMFSLEDSYDFSSLRWWGSMNGFNGQGLDNVTSFQIIVWDATFTKQLYNNKFSINQLQIANTDTYNLYGEAVYEFAIPLSDLQLDSGTFAMNIGAILDDSAGDQFVWAEGVDADNFWQTSQNWGVWSPLPNNIGNTAGGSFVLSAPTPGVVALLGLAGLVSRRRR